MIRVENHTLFQHYDKTIASVLFEENTYPWEVLPKIHDFILEVGMLLPGTEYEEIGEHIWAAKSAVIAPTASITGPVIIGPEAQIRHCAFIRGSAVIGAHAVVGNSTELKNVILFDKVQVPHYNYVGDSILGYRAHMGAGSITSNVKSDRKPVEIRIGDVRVETRMKKVGAILGDHVEVGCGTILNPGSIVGRHTNIYPLSSVRGYVNAHSVYKNQNEIVAKDE